MGSTVTTAIVKKKLGEAAMSQWIMVKLMMWFYRIRCLNVLWFLAAYGFLDLNLLRHGHWPMKCLLTFHARCITNVLCCFNDFYFDFSSVWFWLLMLVIK
jgi:hypothetical protein